MQNKKAKPFLKWALPYQVWLFASIFCFLKKKTKGFTLQSLTQN
jgi:hypothetical protein